MYYQQDEQPLRLVAYYSFNGVAGVFGGLLGYAIGHIPSHPDGGLAQWQYVFLLFGAISLAWGGVLTARLPDLPSSARFLTPRERIVAVDRVAANRQGVKNHHFKAYQLWQAVRDPKTWILFVMSVAAQIPNAAQSSVSGENDPPPPPPKKIHTYLSPLCLYVSLHRRRRRRRRKRARRKVGFGRLVTWFHAGLTN